MFVQFAWSHIWAAREDAPAPDTCVSFAVICFPSYNDSSSFSRHE
jgi:hypothetical protein